MKRLHVHVSIKDLPASILFYRTLFGAEPVVTQPDYAKWMLDDPRVNFAISMNRKANSDKYWVTDPTGIAWETFHTLGRIPAYCEDATVFNHGESTTPVAAPAGCCVPAQRAQPPSCCAK